MESTLENLAIIKVVGVGGGGVNAVNRMINCGLRGVDFIAINTDAQALAVIESDVKIEIGRGETNGLGAGADPMVGERAAQDSEEDIRDALADAKMVFITAGEGGGTGTGAAPVVARIAKELGALTVAVVTKPFGFEGNRRARQAAKGIEVLSKEVDAIIVIPNDRLLEVCDSKITVDQAFMVADEVLHSGVQGITDLITTTANVNVDFQDVNSVLKDAGTAMMGIGSATGDDRAIRAAEAAFMSPLQEATMDGALGVLMLFQGDSNMTMQEVTRAAELINKQASPEANIIWGINIDESLGDELRVTVIAAGFEPDSKDKAPAQLAGMGTATGAGAGLGGAYGQQTAAPSASASPFSAASTGSFTQYQAAPSEPRALGDLPRSAGSHRAPISAPRRDAFEARPDFAGGNTHYPTEPSVNEINEQLNTQGIFVENSDANLDIPPFLR